jgi:hypothetical protein
VPEYPRIEGGQAEGVPRLCWCSRIAGLLVTQVLLLHTLYLQMKPAEAPTRMPIDLAVTLNSARLLVDGRSAPPRMGINGALLRMVWDRFHEGLVVTVTTSESTAALRDEGLCD